MRRPVAFAAVVVVLAAGCGSSDGDNASSPSTAPSTTVAAATGLPLVIDTDLAADDLVALMAVLPRPDVDVRALTVSGTGEVHCAAGIGIARSLLAVANRTSVPVGCGPEVPLGSGEPFPQAWRDAADKAYGVALPKDARPADGDAVTLLREALTSEPAATVLTLGPLTNLAAALRADPTLSDRLPRVVVMGGALDVAGNVGDPASRAEWNLHADPVAAAEVIDALDTVTLVSLDATNQVPIGPSFLSLLAGNAAGQPAAVALQVLQNNPLVSSGQSYFWDPLAGLTALDPDAATTPATIGIDTSAGPDAGRTERVDGGRPVAVLDPPEQQAVETALVASLAGVTASALAPAVPISDLKVSFDGTACRYAGPASLSPGLVRVTFENPSSQEAVALLAHVPPGITVEEIEAWVASHHADATPPPFVDQAAVAEVNAPVSLNTAKGMLIIACTPVPDVDLGLVTTIDIS